MVGNFSRRSFVKMQSRTSFTSASTSFFFSSYSSSETPFLTLRSSLSSNIQSKLFITSIGIKSGYDTANEALISSSPAKILPQYWSDAFSCTTYTSLTAPIECPPRIHAAELVGPAVEPQFILVWAALRQECTPISSGSKAYFFWIISLFSGSFKIIFRVLLNFVEWESFAPGNSGPSLSPISSGFVARYKNIPEMKSASWVNGLPKQ
mmetsp:Transcript_12614/g.18096  ORF Transcript_12614/g.18096 Transcript_12614/m.18096 type:complete len:208 (-) Transcript_12614:778-1401(-)